MFCQESLNLEIRNETWDIGNRKWDIGLRLLEIGNLEIRDGKWGKGKMDIGLE